MLPLPFVKCIGSLYNCKFIAKAFVNKLYNLCRLLLENIFPS